MAVSTAEQRRLFVGGLVKGVAEEELTEKFSRFGQVSNVEIKTRTSETETKTFAYLNLTAEDSAFKKCFTAYNNTKWKGGQLKLQVAKESFLSRLKKEQEEKRECHDKKENKPAVSVQKSPALDGSKKAVPGTPLDDKGTWVMGKFSQVQPVLHLKKPGSAKLVTVDPSKTLHCLKKLKCEDFDSQRSPAQLTWQLEDNTSHINKLRQGIFPTPLPPKNKKACTTTTPTPTKTTLASRLHSLAAEEESASDNDMEVVPVGKVNAANRNLAVNSGYDSDDSAGSADTDEIVFKASGKKTPESGKTMPQSSKKTPQSGKQMPESDKKMPQSSKKTPQSSKKMPLTLSENEGKAPTKTCAVNNGYDSDDSAGSAYMDEIVHKVADKHTPQSGKKTPQSDRKTLESGKKTPQSDKKTPQSGKKTLESGKKTPESDKKTPQSGKKTPQSDKKTLESGKKMKQSDKKTPQSDKKTPQSVPVNSASTAGDKQRPQFEFVKNPELKGKVLKKSKKLRQSETLRAADTDSDSADDGSDLEDDKMEGAGSKGSSKSPADRTPSFKGLGMLSSSDSEGDTSQTSEVVVRLTADTSDSDTSGISSSKKTPKRLHKQKEAARDKARPESAAGKTPEFRGLNMLSSDSEAEGPSDRSAAMVGSKILSSAQQTPESVLKGPHAVAVSPPLQQISRKRRRSSDSVGTDDILCGDSNKSVTAPKPTKKAAARSPKERTEQKELKSPSRAHQTQKQEKTTVQTCEGRERSTKPEVATGLINPDGSAADASLTTSAKKEKRFKAASDLDDSDLDDNDFEKVGRKLAAQALQGQKGGQPGLTTVHQRAREVTPISTASKTKAPQAEEGKITDKRNDSYCKMLHKKQQEKNVLTKALREGTESKVIKFDSDEEEAPPEKTPANKMSLFSDNDDEADSDGGSDLNFSLKPQFEGSKGKKLFELQSRIMDERFRFDERFESDSEGEGDGESDNNDDIKQEDSEDDMTEERSKQLEILEKILGHKPRQRTRPVYEPMSKRRYTEDTADQMTITPKNQQEKKTKNKKRLHDSESEIETEKRVKTKKVEADDSAKTVDSKAEPQEDGIINQDEESEEEKKKNLQTNAESLKGLFGGGSGFSFFGAAEKKEAEEEDEEPVNTSSMAVDGGDEDDEGDEEEEDDEEKEDGKEDEDHDGEKSTPALNGAWLPGQRFQPPARKQPSFLMSRDHPALTAAMRFFKQQHGEDFEELREHYQEERQKIMEVVKERRKKAMRKERITKKYNSKNIKHKFVKK